MEKKKYLSSKNILFLCLPFTWIPNLHPTFFEKDLQRVWERCAACLCLEPCKTLFPQGRLRMSWALGRGKVHSHQKYITVTTEFLSFISLVDSVSARHQ